MTNMANRASTNTVDTPSADYKSQKKWKVSESFSHVEFKQLYLKNKDLFAQFGSRTSIPAEANVKADSKEYELKHATGKIKVKYRKRGDEAAE